MMSPAGLNASTGGAALQQIEIGGLSMDPRSLLFRLATPRCVTQTLSCASTETPMTLPKRASPASGFGQNGSTSNIGTSTRSCCAVAADCQIVNPAPKATTLLVISAAHTKFRLRL